MGVRDMGYGSVGYGVWKIASMGKSVLGYGKCEHYGKMKVGVYGRITVTGVWENE